METFRMWVSSNVASCTGTLFIINHGNIQDVGEFHVASCTGTLFIINHGNIQDVGEFQCGLLYWDFVHN
jgi:hypothetical protein